MLNLSYFIRFQTPAKIQKHGRLLCSLISCETLKNGFMDTLLLKNKVETNFNAGCKRFYNIPLKENKVIPPLNLAKRLIRKKKTQEKPGHWIVSAFSTAQEYDLEKLQKGIVGKDLYEPIPFDDTVPNNTESVQVIAKYQLGTEPRLIYFFKEGSLVAWNVSDLEIENLLEFLKQFEVQPYEKAVVLNEKELMYYTYNPNIKFGQVKRDSICLVENSQEDVLTKYTVSNAMALSVKLGVWEAALDKYIESMESITEDLKLGKRISISRQEVLKRTGHLFALRHSINLDSDLLDTPDFYWEREDLENLYLQTRNFFSISRRTKVMNEKLNHCLELVDLLSSNLSDRHHVRLEWMIIVLIMIEVAFEALHYSDLIVWPWTFAEYVLPEILKPTGTN